MCKATVRVITSGITANCQMVFFVFVYCFYFFSVFVFLFVCFFCCFFWFSFFYLLLFFDIVVFSYLVCLFVLFYFIILFCINFVLFLSWFPFMSLMCFLVSLVILVVFSNCCQQEGGVSVQLLLSYLFLFYVCFYFSFVGSKVILTPQWVEGGIHLLLARV